MYDVDVAEIIIPLHFRYHLLVQRSINVVSFPQTNSLFSTAEMSDDCLSKFASLLRSRQISPPSEPPGEIMAFGVSP